MYVPEWKGPIEGYVVNLLPKVLWRVDRTHDRDDVLQEARMTFWRCCLAYPDIDTPQHFMALFKTAWTRRVHEMSNKNTKVNTATSQLAVVVDDEGAQAVSHDVPGDTDNMGILRTMVRQAPREVMMVLNLFLNAPAELLSMAEQAFHDSNKGVARQDQNAMVRRLLGPAVGEKPVDAVRAYFLERD